MAYLAIVGIHGRVTGRVNITNSCHDTLTLVLDFG